ncbi:hypothetical protein Ddc_17945 [Ditylenchus destructor]|nr:hypothetical protein Ddc_17945 [Ditylenchus destructor]
MWAKGFKSQDDINEAYDDRYMEPLVETNYMGEQGAAQASMVLFDATVWAMEIAGGQVSAVGSKLGNTAAFSWAGKVFRENYAAAKKEIVDSKAAHIASDSFTALADKTSKMYTEDQRRFMFTLASNILFDSTHDHNGIKHDHWKTAMDIEKIYEDKLNGDEDPDNDPAPMITLSEALPEQMHSRDHISPANKKPKEIKLENQEVNEEIKEAANTMGETFHALYHALPSKYRDHNHSHLMDSVAEARRGLKTPGIKSQGESISETHKELTIVDYAQHLWKNMEKDLKTEGIVEEVDDDKAKSYPEVDGIPFSDELNEYHPSPAMTMLPSGTLQNLLHNLEHYYEEHVEEKDDVETDDEPDDEMRMRGRQKERVDTVLEKKKSKTANKRALSL